MAKQRNSPVLAKMDKSPRKSLSSNKPQTTLMKNSNQINTPCDDQGIKAITGRKI